MKNKEFYKLLKKNQSDSGFTLIELLVGLIMSIFVIGALGFGLMTVLQTNQRENSKVKARTENSRALDFISDEVRRARNIESDTTINAPGFPASSDKTVVLALDIPEISDSATMDSDKDATTTNERIVYYLSSNIGPNWKGPQVLYRWGPPLDTSGNYTTGLWDAQALIDGINTTPVTNPCSTGTVSTVNPTGFYACITGTNTAQLFLTGQTKTAIGVNDSQTNDTKVVARARTRAANSTDKNNSISWNVESLGGKYNCSLVNGEWDMRTDFDNNPASADNEITSWRQKSTDVGNGGRQAKPIEVRSDQPLKIISNPERDPLINPTLPSSAKPADCVSSSAPVDHTINFDNLATFNGNSNCDSDGNNCDDNTKVKGNSDPTVQFFKRGSLVPNYGINYEGQKTLGRFLYDQGRAIPTSNPPAGKTLEEFLNDPLTEFKIPVSQREIDDYVNSTNLTPSEKAAAKAKFKVLENDQRIVGFEVGQKYTDKNNDGISITGDKNPGFDLQDNIFIVTSDVFEKKFDTEGKEIKKVE
jgi:Tfp pilus assembly protein PilW